MGCGGWGGIVGRRCAQVEVLSSAVGPPVGAGAMAPKAAAKATAKATGKAVAKAVGKAEAKAEGAAKPKAKAKAKAKAKCTAKKMAKMIQEADKAAAVAAAEAAGAVAAAEHAESEEDDLDGSQFSDGAHNSLRRFSRAIAHKDCDAVCKALAVAIKTLPAGSKKQAQWKTLVSAFGKGGWAACKRAFAGTEMLKTVSSLRTTDTALPKALMIGQCGGNAAVFAQGLADGDIQEVERNGQRFYMFTAFRQLDEAANERTLTAEVDPGRTALKLDFGFSATGNRSVAVAGSASGSAGDSGFAAVADQARCALAPTPAMSDRASEAPLAAALTLGSGGSGAAQQGPAHNDSEQLANARKIWSKAEDALKMSSGQIVKARRAERVGVPASAKSTASRLQSSLALAESLNAEVCSMVIERDLGSVPVLSEKLLELSDELNNMKAAVATAVQLQAPPAVKPCAGSAWQ